MTMMTLKCPKCGGEAKLYLAETNYVGPRRCWKCHEFFTITIVNNQVTACEPLSKEDYEKQEEAKKAAEKSGGGINFSRQEQPEIPKKAAEKPRSGIDFAKQAQPDMFQKLAEKSGGGIDFSKQEEPPIPPKPPEKKKDYIKPLSPKAPSSQTEPKKPAPIDPPDRIQTFVPQEDIKEEDQKPSKSKKNTGYRNPFIPPQT
jgi:hypothetical protein